jgi:ATP-binding protein involved in chromosome partitioning|tara:strand:+ start:2509 stop:3444 length:936 start_codon:yes stop_codon:yes gene_type:complete
MRRAMAHFAARRGYAARPKVPGPGTPAPPGGFKHPALPESLAGTARVVAVASGKGGVGKSTTAVNLACASASVLGLRVGLLDADVHGPSIPTLMNLKDTGPPMVDPASGSMIPIENHGVKCMSMGFLIPEGGAAVWRGPMVMGAIGKMIRDTHWGKLDVLFIDMPPGSGDAHISVSQQVPLSGAVVVSTPNELALADVRRGIDAYQKVNAPIIGLVENMAYFEVEGGSDTGDNSSGEKASKRHYIFGEGGVRKIAQSTGVELLGEVPLDPNVVVASDKGAPIVQSSPESAAAKAYVAMAKRIMEKAQKIEK